MKRKENKGFTLIELLVVIAIIGILSSVVLASLNTARQKSRDAKRVSDMKQLQIALEFSFDATGGYPTGAVSGTPENISTALASLVTAGFISVLPTDPVTTNDPYFYVSNGTSYCLGANVEGTSVVPVSCVAPNVLGAAYDVQVGP